MLGNLRISSSQRSSFSFGKLTVIAFVRMNFHYYFSSCFATTAESEGCYNSDFNFPNLAHFDPYFDCFIGCYFTRRSSVGICFCYLAEFRLCWLLRSVSFDSVDLS